MDTIDLRTQEPIQSEIPIDKPRKHARYVFLVLLFLFLVLMSSFVFLFFVPIQNTQSNIILKISPGMSVSEISSTLKESGVIFSSTAFRVCVRVRGVAGSLQQGEYLFEKSQSLWSVCERVGKGHFGIERVKILLREGLTRTEYADELSKELPLFDKNTFLAQTKDDEGYLFPDTYFFYKSVKAEEVITALKKNFEEKTRLQKNEVESRGEVWKNSIIKASLVELEGKSETDRRMIADIINRRLSKNIPLQLDAPFLYFMNKASLSLTMDDLYTQSPYNTYRNKGLPPTPIANPGLESIAAVIDPLPNEYLYYLSDRDGIIHYAKTFDEHKKNKTEYLK